MQRKGILLVNLGTPDSPTTADVRKYLVEFLTDERVIDIPFLPRQLLVRGIIGQFRAPKSAKSYQKIWTKEGSPLMVYSVQLKELLQQKLGSDYVVELAMRYQSPSIKDALQNLVKQNVSSIKVVSLFPQYASATTGSVHQKIMEIVGEWQNIPNIEFVNSFYDNPKMIKTFAENSKQYDVAQYDHVLFSFHGLPKRQILKADISKDYCKSNGECCGAINEKNQFCYSAQCNATARLIAEELGLSKEKYTITFQSRLGRSEWIKPYTSEVIDALAKQGCKKILVFCPAFVSDCLETIFEIGEEYAEEFKEKGGEDLHLVPSLNTHPLWVEALVDIVKG